MDSLSGTQLSDKEIRGFLWLCISTTKLSRTWTLIQCHVMSSSEICPQTLSFNDYIQFDETNRNIFCFILLLDTILTL